MYGGSSASPGRARVLGGECPTPLLWLPFDVMTTANENIALRVAALGFAGAVGFASVVAIREQLPTEALGLRLPLSVPAGLVVGWGAGIAAPWPMPLAALVAATKAGGTSGLRWPARLCTGIGIAAILGQLAEPVIRRRESWSPAVRVALLFNFGTSAGLAVAGLRYIRNS